MIIKYLNGQSEITETIQKFITDKDEIICTRFDGSRLIISAEDFLRVRGGKVDGQTATPR